ncbi:serine/threonine-protein kinase pim-1-like [Cyclopterus lumpus]|uniref:serine/threonine-protein kinase pim-1-like n=1 Tax=Cyclopterus lumpus TaxID=8103 RepID=UPI0014874AC6|nr:serine/threonine-protein kinase pim-1-like [Cyclopterus lumpus]
MDQDSAKQTKTRGSPALSGGHESCNTPVQEVTVGKRKSRTDDEGANREKKRRLDIKDTELEVCQEVTVAEFEAKYQQQYMLGAGGCGSVFAGFRRKDYHPVAIKHIPKDQVYCKHQDDTGREISIEVAVMMRLQEEKSGSVGASAPISLLDWYDLGQELILVLERPVPAVDLYEYILANKGPLPEEEAKIILRQLVKAAVHLQDNEIFHRDIKVENILIETGSDVPRVRLIDFGLSCFTKQETLKGVFYGTRWHAPPEWRRSRQYSAGPTTVWQMGVVLFQTLHPGEPFKTSSFLKNLLPISETLSEKCQDFMRVCLTQDPKERPSLKQIRLHPWLN